MMKWVIFIALTLILYSYNNRDSYYDREIILCGIGAFILSLAFQSMLDGKSAEFMEEGFKLVFLGVFLKNTSGTWSEKLKSGALLGLTFSTIETFLVLLSDGRIETLVYRFLLTTTMHMSVGVIMAYYLVRNNKIRAFIIPFSVHYTFNLLIYSGDLIYLFLFVGFMKILTNNIRYKSRREEFIRVRGRGVII